MSKILLKAALVAEHAAMGVSLFPVKRFRKAAGIVARANTRSFKASTGRREGAMFVV